MDGLISELMSVILRLFSTFPLPQPPSSPLTELSSLSAQIPPPIVSTREVLRVVFDTDDTINSKGFSASYEIGESQFQAELEGSKKH